MGNTLPSSQRSCTGLITRRQGTSKPRCQLLQENVDYFFENDMLIVVDKSLEKLLKPSLNTLKEYINTPEFLEKYNKKLLLMKYNEFVPNQDIYRWEMETLSHYRNIIG